MSVLGLHGFNRVYFVKAISNPVSSFAYCLMPAQSRKRSGVDSAARNISPTRASAMACIVIDLRHMEKPEVISPRVYKRHRVIIKKAARKLRVSDAEIVRRALEAFSF